MIKILKIKNQQKKLEVENKKRKLVEDRIRLLSTFDESKILDYMNTRIEGLTQKEVLKKQENGFNELSKKKESQILKALMAFINPFTIVLGILAVVSFITDFLLSPVSERDLTTVIIILTMVLVSGVLKIVQEGKSNKASESLKNMISTTATVVRDNEENELDIKEIVCGDIIKLSAGDMLPADVRIIFSKDLFISESALTGESQVVEKFSIKDFNENILQKRNIAFMGSNVISGSAIAVVIAIGDDTIIGSIAKSLGVKRELTSFDKGVNSVSKLLIKFMMVMVPIVFIVNGVTKGDWLSAFLFGISIAVGLTPEMLPMIVTTNLARGSMKMARKKTIVKNLNSIQNLGAMDVFCTDKTGTLTEDHIILEKYLNICGKDDLRVLRHGYLVSLFQTGVKNLLDKAILDRGQHEGLANLKNDYIKVDEIPFDFSRRRMSVVIEDKNEKKQMITKGAVEEIIAICKYVELDGEIVEITQNLIDKVIEVSEELNNKGMRVIAVAQKNNIDKIKEFTVEDEKNMVLIGYIAFLDPPKESAKEAIELLEKYGTSVKVLTGDNDKVTKFICNKLNIKTDKIILGEEIDKLNDKELSNICEKAKIFAKLSPKQKERIISLLKNNGHVVGFMGDGINDAPAMKKADVAISVDTAVDIAKESADIILLEKDLRVLENAIIEGRKTFGNIIKYIKMTASSNFGNMFSVLIASAFLPFLPMMASQILILNLIYDISCISIPWDNVDEEYINKPRQWNADTIGTFMKFIGPVSSIFDILTYIIMFFAICPLIVGSSFANANENKELFIAIFNTGWFIESLWTQTLVIQMIRTQKIPFLQSKASKPVIISTILAIGVGTLIPFTAIGRSLNMTSLPFIYFLVLIIIIILYIVLITIAKKIYIKKYKELL
ncbi:MAG: magnesium-translocating P-type ATPase [Sarcina sp.]